MHTPLHIILAAAILLGANTTTTATSPPAATVVMQDDAARARTAIRGIEDAITQRDVQQLARSFSSKVYLTLFTGENGWYSAEQSYFILRNFFATHTPLSLALTPSAGAGGAPYAVGTLHYMTRGRRASAQIFVSLVRNDNGEYKLNQITIASR
jgi:hypothetical protein